MAASGLSLNTQDESHHEGHGHGVDEGLQHLAYTDISYSTNRFKQCEGERKP